MKTTTEPIEAKAVQPRIEDIERLSGENFQALPEEVKRRYFEYMDRENSPSPAEFYGWAEEYDFDREEP